MLIISWRQHITNEELYADPSHISETIKSRRRLRLAGHCWRSNEAAANLVLWKPQHGQKEPGRPKLDYATLLSKDTGLNLAELGTTMSSRECWRTVVMGSVRPIDDDDDDDDDDLLISMSMTPKTSQLRTVNDELNINEKKMKEMITGSLRGNRHHYVS